MTLRTWTVVWMAWYKRSVSFLLEDGEVGAEEADDATALDALAIMKSGTSASCKRPLRSAVFVVDAAILFLDDGVGWLRGDDSGGGGGAGLSLPCLLLMMARLLLLQLRLRLLLLQLRLRVRLLTSFAEVGMHASWSIVLVLLPLLLLE